MLDLQVMRNPEPLQLVVIIPVAVVHEVLIMIPLQLVVEVMVGVTGAVGEGTRVVEQNCRIPPPMQFVDVLTGTETTELVQIGKKKAVLHEEATVPVTPEHVRWFATVLQDVVDVIVGVARFSKWLL